MTSRSKNRTANTVSIRIFLNKLNKKHSKLTVVAELIPPLKLDTSVITEHRNRLWNEAYQNL
jgi:hypothetical protein